MATVYGQRANTLGALSNSSSEDEQSPEATLLPPSLEKRSQHRKYTQSISKSSLPKKFLGSILIQLSGKRNISLRDGFMLWYHKRNSKIAENTVDRILTANRICEASFLYRLKVFSRRQIERKNKENKECIEEAVQFSLKSNGNSLSEIPLKELIIPITERDEAISPRQQSWMPKKKSDFQAIQIHDKRYKIVESRIRKLDMKADDLIVRLLVRLLDQARKKSLRIGMGNLVGDGSDL